MVPSVKILLSFIYCKSRVPKTISIPSFEDLQASTLRNVELVTSLGPAEKAEIAVP